MHLIPAYTNQGSVFEQSNATTVHLITMSGMLSVDILLQRFEEV